MMAMNWLSERSIQEANRLLGLPEAPFAALIEAAEIVANNDDLLELLRQCVFAEQAALDEGAFSAAVQGLPALSDGRSDALSGALKKRSGLFPVLVVVGLLPWSIRYYRSRGMPQSVLADTLGDLNIWMNRYHAEHGVWGLDNLTWLLHHLGCRLFRLGRLQFMHKRSDHNIVAMRHRMTGRTLIFSEAGVQYRGDGLVNGTNGRFDVERCWTAGVHQDAGGFTGYPILSTGLASQGLIRVSAADWQLAFRRGDPVLDMHIPEGEPLLPEACEESMRKAIRFFARYFPERPFKAFVCVSWLLDSQLADITPATSNITAFQQKLQLFPVLSDERETYSRVFGTEMLDPLTAKSDTGLRRAIIAFAESGQRLRGGGGIRLIDTE